MNLLVSSSTGIVLACGTLMAACFTLYKTYKMEQSLLFVRRMIWLVIVRSIISVAKGAIIIHFEIQKEIDS